MERESEWPYGAARTVVAGELYDTERSALIAHDWHEAPPVGTVHRALYRTRSSNFFMVEFSAKSHKFEGLNPLEVNEAIDAYQELSHQVMDFNEAFPPDLLDAAGIDT